MDLKLWLIFVFVQYLGTDLEEVQGRTIQDEDRQLSMPIMSMPGVILFPGQILPLHLFRPVDVALIKHILDRERQFGLVTTKLVLLLFFSSLIIIYGYVVCMSYHMRAFEYLD